LCLGLLLRMTLNARNKYLNKMQSLQPMDGEGEEGEGDGDVDGEDTERKREKERKPFQITITSDPQTVVREGEPVIEVDSGHHRVEGSHSPRELGSGNHDCEIRQATLVGRIGEVDLELGPREGGLQLDPSLEEIRRDNEIDGESNNSGSGDIVWDSSGSDVLSDYQSDRRGGVWAINWDHLPDQDNDSSSSSSSSSASSSSSSSQDSLDL
jgi:hypothetical protein